MEGQELVDIFAQLFDELEPETPEEINEVLRDAGYDPDEVGVKFSVFAQDALYARRVLSEKENHA